MKTNDSDSLRYIVEFIYKGVRNPFLKTKMKKDFVKAYDRFCEITNGGFIDKLNVEFDKLYPNNCFSANYKVGDDLWSSVEYVEFMRSGFEQVAKTLNESQLSKLMTFKIGDELNLIGEIKSKTKKATGKTIEFVLKALVK